MSVDAIRLVVFDWAGTTVDHGSCAPVAPFVAAFARHGVEVTPAEVRGPMGVHKRDHVRALFRLPAVAARWRDDVAAGRPAPWMVFRIMEAAGVFPPAAVVKVGDTVPDVEEGRNAGAWSVGVTDTGSEVGCTAEEFAALPAGEREERVGAA